MFPQSKDHHFYVSIYSSDIFVYDYVNFILFLGDICRVPAMFWNLHALYIIGILYHNICRSTIILQSILQSFTIILYIFFFFLLFFFFFYPLVMLFFFNQCCYTTKCISALQNLNDIVKCCILLSRSMSGNLVN